MNLILCKCIKLQFRKVMRFYSCYFTTSSTFSMFVCESNFAWFDVIDDDVCLIILHCDYRYHILGNIQIQVNCVVSIIFDNSYKIDPVWHLHLSLVEVSVLNVCELSTGSELPNVLFTSFFCTFLVYPVSLNIFIIWSLYS